MTGKLEILLRNERPEDYRAVEELTREAFWNRHVPGCNEHYLVHIMRNAEAFIAPLDMVAVTEDKLVGHIAYTKAAIACDDGTAREVVSFGPVSVLPQFQGLGIGSGLIEHTLNLAKRLGYPALLIYGDPLYYVRFGFTAAENYKIGTKDDMYAPPLLALELSDGALSDSGGRFSEDAVFNLDDSAAQAFDKTFAPKELRSDLPSQERFRYLISMRKPRK